MKTTAMSGRQATGDLRVGGIAPTAVDLVPPRGRQLMMMIRRGAIHGLVDLAALEVPAAGRMRRRSGDRPARGGQAHMAARPAELAAYEASIARAPSRARPRSTTACPASVVPRLALRGPVLTQTIRFRRPRQPHASGNGSSSAW
jgi:hypothetical protein